MAEFAAAVIGLADFGLKLSKNLYLYGDSVRSASETIDSIARDIERTSTVLKELSMCFDEREGLSLWSVDAKETARETVRECRSVFEKLEKDLGLDKPKKSMIERWRFPFRETNVALLRSNIEKLKSTLQLLLSVGQIAQQRALHAFSREAEERHRKQIKELIQIRNESTKRYQFLLFQQNNSATNTNSGDRDLDGTGDFFEPNDMSGWTISSTSDAGRDFQDLTTCINHLERLLGDFKALEKTLGTPRNQSFQRRDEVRSPYAPLVKPYMRVRRHIDGVLSIKPHHSQTILPKFEVSNNGEYTSYTISLPTQGSDRLYTEAEHEKAIEDAVERTRRDLFQGPGPIRAVEESSKVSHRPPLRGVRSERQEVVRGGRDGRDERDTKLEEERVHEQEIKEREKMLERERRLAREMITAEYKSEKRVKEEQEKGDDEGQRLMVGNSGKPRSSADLQAEIDKIDRELEQLKMKEKKYGEDRLAQEMMEGVAGGDSEDIDDTDDTDDTDGRDGAKAYNKKLRLDRDDKYEKYGEGMEGTVNRNDDEVDKLLKEWTVVFDDGMGAHGR